MTDKQKILQRVANTEAMLKTALQECKQIRMLLEEDVSTSSTVNSIDEHVAMAVAKFRQRLGKKKK
jgi:hypothetical protein